MFSTLQTNNNNNSSSKSLSMSFGVADLPLPALFSFAEQDKEVLTELCPHSKTILLINTKIQWCFLPYCTKLFEKKSHLVISLVWPFQNIWPKVSNIYQLLKLQSETNHMSSLKKRKYFLNMLKRKRGARDNFFCAVIPFQVLVIHQPPRPIELLLIIIES